MPGQYLEDDWQVNDGSYHGEDGERFPEAIQKRIEDSCRKQGWRVPGEENPTSRTYGPGCGIGKGWLPFLIELDEVLAQIDPDYEIHQIKEKFGGLRYYAHASFDSGSHWDQEQRKRIIDNIDDFIRWEAFQAQINHAENKCAHTCEVCGNYGEIGGKHWLRCRCEEHKVD